MLVCRQNAPTQTRVPRFDKMWKCDKNRCVVMESASDSTSIKSAPTSAASRKQVGFAQTRPTLMIPTPQDRQWPQQYTTSSAPTPNPYVRKQSIFIDQLHGIKDFTKSGLGFGEKCAYWMYNKLRAWSRKWFTHMFLTIVLLLYTIGGALVFEVIEGTKQLAWCKKFDEVTSKSMSVCLMMNDVLFLNCNNFVYNFLFIINRVNIQKRAEIINKNS